MECSFRLMVFSLFQEDLPFNTPWWALQCVNRRLCIREAPESLTFSLQSRAALCRRRGPHWLVCFRAVLFFFFFNWRIITLQYCDGFAIHKRKSAVGIHVSPPNWNPLLPRLLSRLSQTPALGVLRHISKSHWFLILHVAMYMFQCYSLKSPHPLPLPLSPKVCSLRGVSFELFL